MSVGRAYSVAVSGVDGQIVEIEADIGRGLLQEPLHARGERVVRVVQEHLVVAHRLEDVGGRRRLDVGELAARAGQERRQLEVVAREGLTLFEHSSGT